MSRTARAARLLLWLLLSLAVLLLGAAALTLPLVVIGAKALETPPPAGPAPDLAALLVQNPAFAVGLVVWTGLAFTATAFAAAPLRLTAPLRWLGTARWMGATLLGAAACAVGSQAVAAAQAALGFPSSEDQLVMDLIRGVPAGSRVVLITAAVALSPVGEELFFRRVLFGNLRQLVPLPLAILASALAFAAAHGEPLNIAVLAWIGVVMALLYQWTGDIRAPIAAHALNNAVAISAGLLMPAG